MDKKLNIVVMAGTIRPGRKSIAAARFVEKIGRTFDDVDIVFVDPEDFTFPTDGDAPEIRDAKYSKITEEADGFFIVTPEYNHSFPSSLKRMLDSEFDNYKHKAVAVAGASSGMWGGVRVAESILPVLRTLGLVVIAPNVYFPKVQDLFDEQGEPKEAFYTDSVKKTFEELIWMAKALKQAREIS